MQDMFAGKFVIGTEMIASQEKLVRDKPEQPMEDVSLTSTESTPTSTLWQWRRYQVWKLAIILPVYKNKGDPLDVKNNRPIALTSSLRIAFERVIASSAHQSRWI
jgi:hypothetical protein